MITLENFTKENKNGVQERALRLDIPNGVQERELHLNILSDGMSNDVTCHIKNKRNGRVITNEEMTIKPTNMDIEDVSIEGANKSITRTVITIFVDGNRVGTTIILEDSTVNNPRSLNPSA